MRFTKSFVGMVVASVIAGSPLLAQEKGFYKDKERGWFWFEDPLEEEQQEEKKPVPPPSPVGQAPKSEMVELNYAWLKENFPKILERSMNNPTDDNLANFAYAQRLMLDMSSRFQSKMTDFMMGETALDENVRRPNAAFALNQFKTEVNEKVKLAIDEINDKSLGLWFFYSSTCQYCYKMLPVIKRFQQMHGVKILAVSLDGGVIPGMEDMNIVVDHNQEVAKQFNVTMTPATLLVLPNNSAELVAEGMRTMPDLEKRYIRAGRIKGLIDRNTYEKTKSVYELNLYKNENGSLMVNKDKLENDPAFLAEALRSRLSDVTAYGTQITPVGTNINTSVNN